MTSDEFSLFLDKQTDLHAVTLLVLVFIVPVLHPQLLLTSPLPNLMGFEPSTYSLQNRTCASFREPYPVELRILLQSSYSPPIDPNCHFKRCKLGNTPRFTSFCIAPRQSPFPMQSSSEVFFLLTTPTHDSSGENNPTGRLFRAFVLLPNAPSITASLRELYLHLSLNDQHGSCPETLLCSPSREPYEYLPLFA